MEKAVGLYLHIPFCAAKCSYCDFHSAPADKNIMADYVAALLKEAEKHRGRRVDSLYIGGGTPSLLGAELLKKLLDGLQKIFNIKGEATLEANPADNLFDVFLAAKQGGINRISMGVQSGIDSELKLIGRRHSTADALRAVEDCRRAGISNISLDLMLGLPQQDGSSLNKSIVFLASLNPTHVSAYILKLEKGTPLYTERNSPLLPDPDTTADLYLQAVERLKDFGYMQYEISNFSKPGFESRHNLKYWQCQEYIGLGASAHGFIDGKRYFYPRDTRGFIENSQIIPDGFGGDPEEKFMLGIRLCRGVALADFPELNLSKKATLYEKHGLCNLKDGYLSLTPKGFLVSNEIIAEFLS